MTGGYIDPLNRKHELVTGFEGGFGSLDIGGTKFPLSRNIYTGGASEIIIKGNKDHLGLVKKPCFDNFYRVLSHIQNGFNFVNPGPQWATTRAVQSSATGCGGISAIHVTNDNVVFVSNNDFHTYVIFSDAYAQPPVKWNSYLASGRVNIKQVPSISLSAVTSGISPIDAVAFSREDAYMSIDGGRTFYYSFVFGGAQNSGGFTRGTHSTLIRLGRDGPYITHDYGKTYTYKSTLWPGTGSYRPTMCYKTITGRIIAHSIDYTGAGDYRTKNIWYSDDDGDTWSASATNIFMQKAWAEPFGRKLLCYSYANSNQWYESTDDGINWTALAITPLFVMTSGVSLYSISGSYYWSEDYGVTMHALVMPNESFNYLLFSETGNGNLCALYTTSIPYSQKLYVWGI
jgi:hypothetical protein